MEDLMTTIFSHITLYANDPKTCATWYEEALGFKLLFYLDDLFYSMAHEQFGSIVVHMAENPDDVGRGAMASLASDDIFGFVEELKSKDIKVDKIIQRGESPHFTYFYDCEGNRWNVVERKQL